MHERSTYVENTPDLMAMTRRKRVAAYARVSGDRDEAFHSLSAQISYYQQKIAEHPDWEFVEVFSDRGITGTKENRPGFQAMLAACREHRVDIVLAKSITRFARNTVILLETVRELKSLGIDIHFEEEHIETLGVKGEFMISILAARAQEESRSASENQKWRIQKSYQKGIPVTGNALGYRMVDHQFLIDDEEEEIVLKIFSLYLQGKGICAIARQLSREGYKTRHGKTRWSKTAIQTILQNEKYQGDLMLQKAYVTDHITKKEVKNHGERPMYLVENAHDAIIDRETFGKVQAEIKRRADQKAPNKSTHYPFTGMVVCGRCGAKFKHKMNAAGTKYQRPVWICSTFDQYGKEFCDSHFVPEEKMSQAACMALSLENLDETILREKVKKIVIPEQYTLDFHMADASIKRITWQHQSRRESWTPEMKEEARKRALAQHAMQRLKEESENGS